MKITEPLFYSATPLSGEGDITLTGDEAHHVVVQRFRVGDAIALFDGRGGVARGKVRQIERANVRVAVAEHRIEPAPLPALDLYCAVPKGDRASVLLDMATQLGMTRFTPVRWERSVAEPSARAEERWQRICLEACKQSRRSYLPEIRAPLDLAAALETAHADQSTILLAHLHMAAKRITASDRCASRFAVFVGPEGGLTAAEVDQALAAGAAIINLGEYILRIETAAVAALALLKETAAVAQTR